MSEPASQGRISSLCSECGAPVDFELGAPQVRCDHCGAGLAVDRGQRLLRLSCPGCGGNFYSFDGSLSGRCHFCRAAPLAVTRQRVLQFVIPPAVRPPPQAGGATLLLLPFWHLKGLMLGWDVGVKVTVEEDHSPQMSSAENYDTYHPPAKIKKESGPQKLFRGRVVDLSVPDPATRALGATSLHWRAAVFPMEPYAERHEQLGRVVRPALEVEEVRGELVERAYRIGAPEEGITRLDCQRQDLVSEELTLLFYPFWSSEEPGGDRVLVDGVTGEPEPTFRSGGPEPEAAAASVLDDLRVIELRCAACGEELRAGNRSVVLPCAGCGAFWLVTREGLERFEATYAAPNVSAGGGERVWLPFWRVPVEVGYCGKQATTVAELIARLGVTRATTVVEAEPLDAPLCYYAPAYGALRAPRVDHAARDMTRAQPRLEPGETGGGEVFTCFFGPEDARRLAYVTWIQVLPSAVAHQLRSLRLTPGAPALWYLPFEERERELVNLVTGARYERASFRGLRH
jgi:hypothetical protein